MKKMLDQDQVNEIKNIWQTICYRMNERRLSPADLATRTRYSKQHIERGISGEVIPITFDFLRDCFVAFNLKSARAKYYEDTEEILSFQEYVEHLKPKPSMLPRQGNFWDNDD